MVKVILLFLAAVLAAVQAAGLPQDCGQRKLKTVNLIINGKPAPVGNWPWHTAIFHREGNTFKYKCGGTIIDANTILTAAHCVRLSSGDISSKDLSVQVGRNRLYVGDERAREHEAEYILVHRRYKFGNVVHDIALIRLATNIEFTPYIQPVCLWDRGEDRLLIESRPGTIVGFGRTAFFDISTTLNEAQVPVVDNDVCINSNPNTFRLVLTREMYCAGNKDGVNACDGDSGGGMFYEINGRWYLRGVVSFSPSTELGKCDPYQYVVFTDAARYLDWIGQQLNATFIEAPAPSDVHPKRQLLGQECGSNSHPGRKETDKPVFLNYPWVGLIEYPQPGSQTKRTLCHAILISDRCLVTAAQCVFNINPRPNSIRLGEYDTSNSQDCDRLGGSSVCSPPTQTFPIETITVHQQYNKPRFANDIALIRLRQKADISQQNVQPICLPLSKQLRSYKPPTFTRAGWKASNSQPKMQRSEAEVVESVACQRNYTDHRIPLQKTFRQLCVRRDEPSSDGKCVFDVAAVPLQAVQNISERDGERYVLHGFLSFGPTKCTHEYPDVYTNVGTYLEWILDNMLP